MMPNTSSSKRRFFAAVIVALFAFPALTLTGSPVDTAQAQVLTPIEMNPWLVANPAGSGPCPAPYEDTPWGDDTICINPSPAFGYPGAPKFDNYPAPSSLPGYDQAGEPTIGISWKTDNVMYRSGTNTYRLVFNDEVNPPSVIWTDATAPLDTSSVMNLDPILHTDPISGRTFSGGLSGACSSMSYSDDDGQNWYPMEMACPEGLGWDHQTIGSGAWMNSLVGLQDEIYPRAVWYCAQAGPALGGDSCSLSYDGGVTFTPTEPVAFCGLHGHIRVNPATGDAYLPFKSCGSPASAALLRGHVGAGLGLINGGAASISWELVPLPCVDDASIFLACGSGSFDPSVAFSEEDGWMYVAQAEEDGIWVAMSKDGGDTWESLGDEQYYGGYMNSGSWPPITANTFRPGQYIDLGQLHNPPILEAEFADVVVGDNERVAVSFMGSTVRGNGASPPGSHENDCGAGSDVHEWHYYVAISYDAGQTWSVKQITEHPVQIGGIWDGGLDTDPNSPTFGGSPPCRNLLDFMDMDMDSEGRIHIAYADGCVPIPTATPSGVPCDTGSPGTDSNGAWATLARQTTGGGLLSAYDKPYPGAITHHSDDGWLSLIDEPPVTRGLGTVALTEPAPLQTFYTEQFTPQPITVKGEVTRPVSLSNLGLSLTAPSTTFVGEAARVDAVVSGGSGEYMCQLSSVGYTRILTNHMCTGSGVYMNTTGIHQFVFEEFDVNDQNLRAKQTFTITAVDKPVDCMEAPLVTDPEHDAGWTLMYLDEQYVLEGDNHDIRAACVEEDGTDTFLVRVQMQNFDELKVGSTGYDHTQNFYGVSFCLDNMSPETVCYLARTFIAGGVRVWESGYTPTPTAVDNPAIAAAGTDFCAHDVLHPTGNTIEVDKAQAVFRFQLDKLNIRPTSGTPSGCGDWAEDATHAGAIEGTDLFELTAGSRGRYQVPGVGTFTAAEDATSPTTGQQLPFQLGVPELPPLEVDARGVYHADVGQIIDLIPMFTGVHGTLVCEWQKVKEMRFLVASASGAKPQQTCDATQVVFDKPGLYRVNYTVADWLVDGKTVTFIDSDTDNALFVITDPAAKWDEYVVLKWDGKQEFARIPVDTRYEPVVEFEAVVDLSEKDEDGNFVYNALPLGSGLYHRVTAEYFDPDATDSMEVERQVNIVFPQRVGSPMIPIDPRDLPTFGFDDHPDIQATKTDADDDNIADYKDLCPYVDSFNEDADGDGIGDECDEDLDGDNVPNVRDNCIFAANPGQEDADLDGVGDACTGDLDGDGVADGKDNCPFVANPPVKGRQADYDGDGFGDACDADMDGDSVANLKDAFPLDRKEWSDLDGDGIGDNSDPDADGDGVENGVELAAGTDPHDATSYPVETSQRESLTPVQAAKVAGGWGVFAMFVILVVAVGGVLALLWMPRKD